MLLSAARTTTPHQRAALAVSLVALITALATLPFAQTVWATFPGFILIQQTLQAGNCLIVAALLYGQYSIARTIELAVLGSGYLLTALLIITHTLSFPGAISETGLLTGGPQSTPWLYVGWHAALPLAVIAYASGRRSLYPGRVFDTARIPILLSILSAVAIAVVITGVITAGHEWLPRLIENGRLMPASRTAVATLLLLQLGSVLVLTKKRWRSVLDVWLMATMFVSVCTVSLVSLVSAQRFDTGWYVGRIFDVLTSTFILFLLLSETARLYGRYALAAALENREKERRVNEMESILIHLSRVSELAQNLSALAHEVNQPLTAISNYAAACMELVDHAPERLKPLLRRLSEQATRAADIIQDIRDFVAQHATEKRVENIHDLLQRAVRLALAGEHQGSPMIEMRFSPDVSSALIDRVQIEQVIFNLVRNAVEAMAQCPRRVLTLTTELMSDGMIEVSVADTGPGLAPEIHSRLFEPFVTTKPSGLGVGLSICRVIVEAHGGHLQAHDKPGGGTVFSFTLQQAFGSDEPILA